MKIAITIIALVVGSATAFAAPVDPVVLAVDGTSIYVDLGAKDGVGTGSELELLHEITVRDPKSGAMLRDRFALGRLVVEKSGNGVSIAHADAELAKRVLAGDHVRLVSEKRQFADPWVDTTTVEVPQTPVAPPVPGAPPIDHVALVTAAWQKTLGKPIEARIAIWLDFVKAVPSTPYRRAIDNELANLRTQGDARAAALAAAAATPTVTRAPQIADLVTQVSNAEIAIATGPIGRATPNRPIALAFVSRTVFKKPWLIYVRSEGAKGYERSELVSDGDAYLRVTIPAAQVKPGKLDWYVEIAGIPVAGSQEVPNTIEVDDDVGEAPIESGRTHIDGHVDYVDFDGALSTGYDQYVLAELDFGYRFIDPVYAVRVGFGALNGTGGPKDVIDLDNHCLDENDVYRCRRLTFTYVYTELEFRLRPNVALLVRPSAGLLTSDTMDTGTNRCGSSSDIAGCNFQTPLGLRGRVRLGAETGTNLVLGAAFTAHVGTLLEAAYNWRPHPIVPVQITVQVTDQPVVEDFGVRLIADVGIRRVPWFYPSLRASYQARDIDHSGFSGGMALNFDW